DVDPLAHVAVKLLLEGLLIGDVIFTQRDSAAYDVDATLFGDVPDGREPGFAAIPCRRDIDLRAPCVHGVARQRHVILPADQAAEFAQRGIVHAQCTAVTLRPCQAFARSRNQLAVLAHDLAL